MARKKPFSLPKDLSYSTARERLQQIVARLQAGSVDIDALGDTVEEANALVRFCQEKLRDTELQVERLLDRSGQ